MKPSVIKVVPLLACAIASLLGLATSVRAEDTGAPRNSAIFDKLLKQTGVYDRSKDGKTPDFVSDPTWPQPLPPERVGDAVVRVIRSGRAEIFVPGWMTIPARLRGAAPGLFRRAIDRFG